jgi:transcriptional regulator with XRE-family HTH domain
VESNHLGQYLRDLRQTKGLTTRQLGSITECNQSFITRLESGKRFTTLDRLWRIIDKLEGDFGHALYLLCLDAGVPAEVARKATGQDDG